jgi:hypothetical protein
MDDIGAPFAQSSGASGDRADFPSLRRMVSNHSALEVGAHRRWSGRRDRRARAACVGVRFEGLRSNRAERLVGGTVEKKGGGCAGAGSRQRPRKLSTGDFTPSSGCAVGTLVYGTRRSREQLTVLSSPRCARCRTHTAVGSLSGPSKGSLTISLSRISVISSRHFRSYATTVL